MIVNQLDVLTCASEEDCDEFSRLLLYRYDPATDLWTFLSVTEVPLGSPMGGVIGGKLYATGDPSGSLVAYDPVTTGGRRRRRCLANAGLGPALPWQRSSTYSEASSEAPTGPQHRSARRVCMTRLPTDPPDRG